MLPLAPARLSMTIVWSPPLLQDVADDPRLDVDPAAGREAENEANRLVGKLRPRCAGAERNAQHHRETHRQRIGALTSSSILRRITSVPRRRPDPLGQHGRPRRVGERRMKRLVQAIPSG